MPAFPIMSAQGIDESSPIEAETEVLDINELLEAVDSKVESVEANMKEIKEYVTNIKNLIIQQNSLNEQREAEDLEDTLETTLNAEKITRTAINLMSEMGAGPLDPGRFQDFLLSKSFGKPLPKVLPILREHTHDIRGACGQLKQFRSKLRESHNKYMGGRKKDVNLEKRIELLVKNLEKEIAEEERDGRRQTSMRDFVY